MTPDQLTRSAYLPLRVKYAERGRCMAIIDQTIRGWSRLIEDAGPDADVTVESVIDSLLIARGQIEDGHPNQGNYD